MISQDQFGVIWKALAPIGSVHIKIRSYEKKSKTISKDFSASAEIGFVITPETKSIDRNVSLSFFTNTLPQKPPQIVQQTGATCWAAAFESYSTLQGFKVSQEDIRKDFRERGCLVDLSSSATDGLPMDNYGPAFGKFGFENISVTNPFEEIMRRIDKGFPVLLDVDAGSFSSNINARHTIVVYSYGSSDADEIHRSSPQKDWIAFWNPHPKDHEYYAKKLYDFSSFYILSPLGGTVEKECTRYCNYNMTPSERIMAQCKNT